jgi:hypothetical protein
MGVAFVRGHQEERPRLARVRQRLVAALGQAFESLNRQ